jgi:lipopolysaccharide transport system permease protein
VNDDDIYSSIKKYRLVLMLGYIDVRQKYSRSTLGPFWVTISMGVMIASIGIIFGSIMGAPMEIFLPSLTLGMILWGFISGVIGESCNAFISAEAIIKQLPLPLFVHILRVVWRNIIIFFHNLIIFPLVAIIFQQPINLFSLYSIIGFILIIINLCWISLLISILCTRYRDLPQIINSIMQVLFYLTPIVWLPNTDLIKSKLYILEFNPFYNFLDIFRTPLMGSAPELSSWYVSATLALAGWFLVFSVFKRYKNKIAYWL